MDEMGSFVFMAPGYLTRSRFRFSPGLMEKKPNFRYVKGLLQAIRQPLFVEPASLASTLSVQG